MTVTAYEIYQSNWLLILEIIGTYHIKFCSFNDFRSTNF